PWAETADAALEAAKSSGRPALLFFTDGKKDSADMQAILLSDEMKPLMAAFPCARIAVAKDDPTCKKANVLSAPVILVVDATADAPFAKPLRKINGRRTAKSLKDDLEKLVAPKGDKNQLTAVEALSREDETR